MGEDIKVDEDDTLEVDVKDEPTNTADITSLGCSLMMDQESLNDIDGGNFHFGQYLKEKDGLQRHISSSQLEWDRVRKQVFTYTDASIYPSYPEAHTSNEEKPVVTLHASSHSSHPYLTRKRSNNSCDSRTTT